MKVKFLTSLIIILFASLSLQAAIEISGTDCICSGGTGAIYLTVEPDDGMISAGPFSYKWENAIGDLISEDKDLIGVVETGEYTVTVTNAFGCQKILTSEIMNCVEVNASPVCICTPGGYGSVNLEILNGSGSYTYFWDGPSIADPMAPVPIINAVGDYSVTIVDNVTGCEANAETYVGECNFDISSFVQTYPNCDENGTSTISIQLPTGAGLGPFQFSWLQTGVGLVEQDMSYDGSATFENAVEGEYYIKLITTNGCEVQSSAIQIETVAPLMVEYVITPVNTGSDGVISLTVSGSQGPFTYYLDGVQTAYPFPGLEAGSYNVVVEDNATGCSESMNIIVHTCIELEQAVSQSLAGTIPSGMSSNNGGVGSIDLSITDEFPGYDFAFVWSTGDETEDLSNLTPGNYGVSVTLNSGNCSFTVEELWEICSFTVEFNTSPGNCFGAPLQVMVTPSTGNYSYIWSTGSTQSNILATFGTTYDVTVTANGSVDCQATASINIDYPVLEILGADIINSTYGNNDGSIEISVEGGREPYSYSWSNGATGQINSGIGPGCYGVTVTDVCNNSTSGVFCVQCEFGSDDMTVMVTDIDCSTENLGAIDIVELPEVDVTPIFSFQWSNGATSQNVAGLAEGDYCVTVTETVSGCLAIGCYQVGNTGSIDIAMESERSCFPLEENEITATPSTSSTGPFSYEWSVVNWFPFPSLEPYATTPIGTLKDVPVGWYTVNVTDVRGCTGTNFTIMYPPAPTFGVDVTLPDPICHGETIIAEAEIAPGIAGTLPLMPLTYSWQNFISSPTGPVGTPPTNTTQPTFEVLWNGMYSVTATDANGCQGITVFDVERSPEIGIETEWIQHVCTNENYYPSGPEGFISLKNDLGGVSPYSYQWCCDGQVPSNGQTYYMTTPGTYSTTVTDAVGCTKEASFEILEGEGVSDIYINSVSPSCSCCEDGTIQITILQDFPPYTLYMYKDGSLVEEFTMTWIQLNIEGIGIGEYTFDVHSGSNCYDPTEFTHEVSSPIPPPEITIAQIIPQTSTSLGSIDVEVNGGSTPYSYNWSNGASTQDLNSLPSGTYSLTVTDGDGCIVSEEDIVICNGANPFNYSLPSTYPAAFVKTCDDGPGSIEVPAPPIGTGTPEFTYVWSGPSGFSEVGQKIEGLTIPGQYCVTITDACGLTAEHCQKLECDCDVIDVHTTIDDCSRADPGSIRIKEIIPGERDYFIKWNTLGNIEYSLVHVDENNDIENVIFGENPKEFPGGINCFQIIDAESGCANENECMRMYSDHTCLYHLEKPRYDGSGNVPASDDGLMDALEEYFPAYENNFISRCGMIDPCQNTSDDYLGTNRLKYSPYSTTQPCKSGGKLECYGCGVPGDGTKYFEVPQNNSGYLLENIEGKCYCVWPPGIVEGNSFYELLGRTDLLVSTSYPNWSPFVEQKNYATQNLYSAGVTGVFDCNTDPIDPTDPTDPPIGPSCEEFPECVNCTFVPNPDFCVYDVYCENEGGIPEPSGDELPAEQVCFMSSDALVPELCSIFEHCEFNSCVNYTESVILVADSYNGQIGFSLDDIQQLSNVHPILEPYFGQLDCGDDNWCSCSEVSQVFPADCPSCVNPLTLPDDPEGFINYLKGQFKKNFSLSVYPNPFKNELNIKVTTDISGEGSIIMSDILGKVIWSERQEFFKGSNTLKWTPESNIPSGIYQLIIIDKFGRQTSEKVVYSKN